jgi:putative membrane protein
MELVGASMNQNQRGLPQYIALVAKGFCMGAADVVPGVSGGTMAFILGIYEELIRSIRAFDIEVVKLFFTLKIKQALEKVNWKFLVCVGCGIFLAIFTLAKGLAWLLENQPVLIWSFFFGLVLASVAVVSRRVPSWSLPLAAACLIAAIGAFALVGLVPMKTPETWWFLFLSGAVAICAMILPGISGAFIFVLLGKYHYVLQAVNNRDFLTLFIVGCGAAVGLILFSRLLNWLFREHHDLAIAILAGLMLGSLRKVWPWKVMDANALPQAFNGETAMALGLVVCGAIVVLLLERLGAVKGGSKA